MKRYDIAAYIWPSYHYEPRVEQTADAIAGALGFDSATAYQYAMDAGQSGDYVVWANRAIGRWPECKAAYGTFYPHCCPTCAGDTGTCGRFGRCSEKQDDAGKPSEAASQSHPVSRL